MSDMKREEVLQAAAQLLSAAASLVKAVAPPSEEAAAPRLADAQAPVPPIHPVPPAIPALARADSPAWGPALHPNGAAGTAQLGHNYFATHVPGTSAGGADPYKIAWDPTRGATWKDFARIFHWLFHSAEVFDQSGAFNALPFEGLVILQKMVREYHLTLPATEAPITAGDGFPWPTATIPGLPTTPVGLTRRQAISAYLATFNNEKDGTPAKRDGDFAAFPSAGPLQLTHGQIVEFHHALFTQKDLRLLSPFDVLSTRIW